MASEEPASVVVEAVVAPVVVVEKPEEKLFGFTTANHAINLSKGLTAPVMFGAILLTQNFTNGALVYATIHGLYGVLWVLKQVYFPDKNFIKKTSEMVAFNLGVGLEVEDPNVESVFTFVTFLAVDLYWLGGLSLIASKHEIHPLRICLAVALFSFGVFMHFGADVQKFERLKYKKGLITDGYFAICRSPGFLGEILIYSGFFVMCPLGWPLLISVLTMVVGIPTFIIGKERSISRHAEYAEYKKKTALLFPYIL